MTPTITKEATMHGDHVVVTWLVGCVHAEIADRPVVDTTWTRADHLLDYLALGIADTWEQRHRGAAHNEPAGGDAAELIRLTGLDQLQVTVNGHTVGTAEAVAAWGSWIRRLLDEHTRRH